MSASDIRAAGGVVWRSGPADSTEIAVVHRPHYDDWTLPKGKLEGSESALRAAVREVGEEVGRAVAVTHRLPSTTYVTDGRGKQVHYWAMRDTGSVAPSPAGAEVDQVEWLSVAAAAKRLDYDTDRTVLRAFQYPRPADEGTVVLVRHARAGKRAGWAGDDRARPLDVRGRAQADALARQLLCFAPDTLHAADRVRCEQTLGPLAIALGKVIQSAPGVSDEAFLADPTTAVRTVQALAARGGVGVLCSQGGAIPGLLDLLLPTALRATVRSTVTRKGAWWVLGFAGGWPVWVDRYDRAV